MVFFLGFIPEFIDIHCGNVVVEMDTAVLLYRRYPLLHFTLASHA